MNTEEYVKSIRAEGKSVGKVRNITLAERERMKFKSEFTGIIMAAWQKGATADNYKQKLRFLKRFKRLAFKATFTKKKLVPAEARLGSIIIEQIFTGTINNRPAVHIVKAQLYAALAGETYYDVFIGRDPFVGKKRCNINRDDYSELLSLLKLKER